MKIDVYSHGFAVSEISPNHIKVIEDFCRGLIQWKMEFIGGQKSYKPACTYAASNIHRDYYRFHINLLTDFKQHLAYHQIPSNSYNLTEHASPTGERFIADFDVKDLPPPWKAQPIIIDHVLSPGANKIVTLQTGQGKTTIAKHTMHRYGVRTACFMKGGYIDQWLKDCVKSFHFKRGEVLSIRGQASLTGLMEMHLSGELDAKLIFISLNTYSEYVKHYEFNGVTAMYPISPDRFFDDLGIGLMVLDEAHQLPHQTMKVFAYCHVSKILSLSATLDTRDRFMQRIYDIMYPITDRFNGGFYDAFIKVKDIRYRMQTPGRVKCTGAMGYSHNAFEASMMTRKNAKIFANYERLISLYVDYFVSVMQKGQSIFVFFATINFCTHFQKVFAKRYPQLNCVRYVGSKDKRSVVDDGEIVCTTVQSAGTAIDKPNLRVGFLTIGIDTQQGNEQVLGRTRRLVDFPDTDAEFWCLTCVDVPKQVQYTDNRKRAFDGKIASWTTEHAPIVV